jgi:thiol-disulfide isomerase/thioredoxin
MIKRLKLSYLLNGIFVLVILVIVFNPAAKALLIRGLMKVGLFQPDVTQNLKTGSRELPAITLENSNGKMINLTDLKGKVIFINFWTTWCPPCIAEMPSIDDLHGKLKANKNIVFLMVDADHDFSKSKPFMKKYHFDLPLYQANTAVPENLLGSSIPTTVIFDKSGEMIFHHEGAGDYSNAKIIAYLTHLAN